MKVSLAATAKSKITQTTQEQMTNHESHMILLTKKKTSYLNHNSILQKVSYQKNIDGTESIHHLVSDTCKVAIKLIHRL